MDNDYRKQWDKTVFEYNQLQAYESKGVEVGRTVKKFPLLRPREYKYPLPFLSCLIWFGLIFPLLERLWMFVIVTNH
ncbi:Homeobox/lipid-binding domain protein [Arachis hypogaea]|nr:Homeobox/lipid-binding domain protein [Arachis hypogaea]